MKYLAGILLILAALLPALRPTAYAQTPSAVPAQRMITGAISEAVRTRLFGNTRPEATAANDRGLVDDAMPLPHLQLQLRRPADREQALQTLIDQLHDPKSPNFHHWLTAAEFGERFGPAQSDIDAVTGWLTQQGFTVNFVSPNGLSIDYSGTAGQVRTAFHTEIHRLSVNGVAHFANMSDPEIPSALAPAVVGIVALHDFKPRSQRVQKSSNTTVGGGDFYLTPSDLATIYNFNPLFNAGYSGQGQTIAVVEPTNLWSDDDWTKFRSTFGLSGYSAGSLTTIHPAPPFGNTNCTDPGTPDNGDDGEAALDVEYASAGAPSAAIIVASCAATDTNDPELIAIQNLTNGATHPFIISDSYGECEAENGAANIAAYGAIFQQGVAMGISYFVAAGDEEAVSCDGDPGEPFTPIHGIGVDAQAATPYAVATGGTDFSDTYYNENLTYWSGTNSPSHGSALSYIPEIPWNDSCASTLWATYNTYQTTYGSSGSCNNMAHGFLNNSGGSGGPSGCATGSPSVHGVVSGTCQGWPKPSWQSILGNPADGVRDIPDVSLFASQGPWNHIYIYCYSDTRTPGNGGEPCTGAVGNWATSGGTSFTAPIYAGIQALVNQYTGSPQGLPNYVYYTIAAAEYGASGNSGCNSSNGNTVNASCIFYDVTLGDNDAPCKADTLSNEAGVYNCYIPSGTYGVISTDNNSYQPAYTTNIGWDFPTGIGTTNVYNLVTNWVVAGGGSAGLTVSVVGSGTVTSTSGINCSTTCNATFASGPQVTLTATPANESNWVFSGWSGACSGSGSCAVTMNQAQSVTATFVQGFVLTASVSGSGTVTSSPGTIGCPSTCSDGYATNTAVTLTATPANGWAFDGWSGSACGGSFGSCSVTMIQALSITASFAQIDYTLSVGVAGDGTVTSSPAAISCGSQCTADFLSGAQVTLAATPGANAVFNGWSDACSGSGSCVVTMNSSESVTAMFSSPGSSSLISQTWVSASLGNDSNPCTIQAPCLTFAAALALTSPGGEVDVLDPGDFGSATITQSVTIQGLAANPSGIMPSSGTSGIVISAGANDVVSLRGLVFDGASVSGTSGVIFNSGARLEVDYCTFLGFTTSGLTFSPGAGSGNPVKMAVRHSRFVNNAIGMLLMPASAVTSSVDLRWLNIDHNRSDGLQINGTGGSGTTNVAIADSSTSVNAGNGIDTISGPGNVSLDAIRMVVSNNGADGILSNQSAGGGANVTVGSSLLDRNAVAAQSTGGGGLLSYMNNQLTGNGSNGSFSGTSALR
jgi:hypothetical protein